MGEADFPVSMLLCGGGCSHVATSLDGHFHVKDVFVSLLDDTITQVPNEPYVVEIEPAGGAGHD